jgi:hypothetical protein
MPNDCTKRRLPWRMGGASYAAEGVELHSSSTCHRLDRVERTCRWRDPGSRAASSPCPHLLVTPSTCRHIRAIFHRSHTEDAYSARMHSHAATLRSNVERLSARRRPMARTHAHACTHTRRRRGGGARERASREHKVALVRKARPKAMAYPAESLEPLALQQVACLRPFVLFRRRVRSHRFDLVERTNKQTNKQAHRRHGAAGFARLGSHICKRCAKPEVSAQMWSISVSMCTVPAQTSPVGEARVCGWIRRHYLSNQQRCSETTGPRSATI